jgi:hypothetical protein
MSAPRLLTESPELVAEQRRPLPGQRDLFGGADVTQAPPPPARPAQLSRLGEVAP